MSLLVVRRCSLSFVGVRGSFFVARRSLLCVVCCVLLIVSLLAAGCSCFMTVLVGWVFVFLSLVIVVVSCCELFVVIRC